MKPFMLPLAATLLLGAAGCAPMQDTGVQSAGRAGQQQVVLGAEGLLTGSVGLHPGISIGFGTPQAEVISAISAIRGRPTETGRNNDCPTGAVDFAAWGPFFVHFENGRFVGYVIDGGVPNPPITNDRGLAIGVRRNALDSDDEIVADPNSTIGTEASVNGVGVLFESAAADARVETLFAGVTCFAR